MPNGEINNEKGEIVYTVDENGDYRFTIKYNKVTNEKILENGTKSIVVNVSELKTNNTEFTLSSDSEFDKVMDDIKKSPNKEIMLYVTSNITNEIVGIEGKHITVTSKLNSTNDTPYKISLGTYLEGDLTIDNVGFSESLYAQGHKLIITEANAENKIGGHIYGGSNGEDVASTNLEINGGTYNGICGGSIDANVLGDTNVKIGKKFKSSYRNGSAWDYIIGGGYGGDVLGNVNLTINSDYPVGAIIGAGYANKSKDKGRVHGNVNIKYISGECKSIFAGGYNGNGEYVETAAKVDGDVYLQLGDPSFSRDDKKVETKQYFVCGGKFNSVGNVHINIENGTNLTDEGAPNCPNLYGGCEGGIVRGSVDITINGGTGNNTATIYGGTKNITALDNPIKWGILNKDNKEYAIDIVVNSRVEACINPESDIYDETINGKSRVLINKGAYSTLISSIWANTEKQAKEVDVIFNNVGDIKNDTYLEWLKIRNVENIFVKNNSNVSICNYSSPVFSNVDNVTIEENSTLALNGAETINGNLKIEKGSTLALNRAPESENSKDIPALFTAKGSAKGEGLIYAMTPKDWKDGYYFNNKLEPSTPKEMEVYLKANKNDSENGFILKNNDVVVKGYYLNRVDDPNKKDNFMWQVEKGELLTLDYRFVSDDNNKTELPEEVLDEVKQFKEENGHHNGDEINVDELNKKIEDKDIEVSNGTWYFEGWAYKENENSNYEYIKEHEIEMHKDMELVGVWHFEPNSTGGGGGGTIVTPPTDPDRIEGNDRIETSVETSKDLYPNGTNAVVLANCERYTDVLTADPFAIQEKASALLTYKYEIPEKTLKEIERLGAKKIYISGGYDAVSKKVVDELAAKGYEIFRFDGVDRYDTARKIAIKIREKGNTNAAELASGEDFPDALCMTPLAVKDQAPILLTKKDSIPKYTKQALAEWDIAVSYTHLTLPTNSLV